MNTEHSTGKGTLLAEPRIVLKRAGIIDPDSIEDYIIHDGYLVSGKVLSEMRSDEVISLIKESNLRGRGGAGFPTGGVLLLVQKLKRNSLFVTQMKANLELLKIG